MLSRLRRTIGRFFSKSRKVNHEPINKVSLIVIIVVDLFILGNVFAGLDDISRWPLSPAEAYPCHISWEREYRENSSPTKDYDFLLSRVTVPDDLPNLAFEGRERTSRIGKVSEVCETYAETAEAVASAENRAIAKRINDTEAEIISFTSKNSTIRQQYDSTLLEEIAGQPREQSINAVEAAQARAEIEANDRAIAQREAILETLKSELIETPASQALLALLNNEQEFQKVDDGYNRAAFWYPSIQLFFQGLFLLPLVVITSLIHRFAQRKNYGYVALISWHLLVIFCIPLLWKIFEFLQVGFLVELILDLIEVLLGGLRFLLNYLQILIIPVIGFGIIKFFQKVVFNTRLQAANRVQNMRCIRCAKKIRKHDIHCPHCSYAQYHECHSCHNLTYQHLPHCKHCGADQPLNL
ncbi:MAG: hypothetical protein AAFQ40_08235 [Cyanobacteria bacterium J06623_5]